ncbi:hypothetical protein NT6N_08500 [Oceaniferula spumae]|uniref:Uncharacterized protein n=1 Tax=Oceaniferula spumae TaxID=2979115 RepID=A0AAT9FIJ0_9BACT
MEQPEEKSNSTRKSIISTVALIGLLLLLMYAAPMLSEKLKEWSEKSKAEQKADVSSEELSSHGPEVSPELAQWLPQIEAQLPKNEQGGPKYQLLHVRLSQDSSQLLLDLQEQKEEGAQRVDIILSRDQFGRYTSEDEAFPMRVYPPAASH